MNLPEEQSKNILRQTSKSEENRYIDRLGECAKTSSSLKQSSIKINRIIDPRYRVSDSIYDESIPTLKVIRLTAELCGLGRLRVPILFSQPYILPQHKMFHIRSLRSTKDVPCFYCQCCYTVVDHKIRVTKLCAYLWLSIPKLLFVFYNGYKLNVRSVISFYVIQFKLSSPFSMDFDMFYTSAIMFSDLGVMLKWLCLYYQMSIMSWFKVFPLRICTLGDINRVHRVI